MSNFLECNVQGPYGKCSLKSPYFKPNQIWETVGGEVVIILESTEDKCTYGTVDGEIFLINSDGKTYVEPIDKNNDIFELLVDPECSVGGLRNG